MSDDAQHDVYVIEDEDGEIVQWYERPKLQVSTAQATGATLGAFALGALTAVGILALLGRIRD